ncbi:hypothetical protein PSN45_002838 [Yamadazyma tenuis]|uniref:Uncharacterized protein n=1 Tax=Candida tenuis (strain ATCC 10573 / BCRC 21748 / CBS 615 / JCM 9827 / NBRC 10315 / NRRL Y-1498 / VKM Y-70) TaxID=590646 RepID=G3AWJ7_CANTC|nr:uncharacterized protein CANTEDRAFT_132811 [Yamadazyma tenuis ATCC 10573]EGV66555.1 hypothetical protein CANTEDRAFT_132811 [Yamadazyma tenuis ATCC 10573]WEJ95323.1 hypothetical protein PSN45_002838 [Yamadazyma tenuis]
MIRTLIKNSSFKINPFEHLDSRSIQSMDKILSILNSKAEKQPDSNPIDKYERFGQQVFKYKIIRYLNDKNILARDSRIWRNTRSKYRDFFNDSIKDYNNYLQQNIGRDYVGIAKFFIHHDLGCIHSLDKPLDTMLAVPDKEVDYGLPALKIPSAQAYTSHNPYMIIGSLSSKKNNLYLLPFLVNHKKMVTHMVHRHQIKQDISLMPPELFHGLMEAYNYEGEVLYEILVKKFLASEPHYSKDDFMENRFITNSNKVKVVVARQSNFPTRLSSLRDYKHTLNLLDNVNPSKVMINHFNIFLAMWFRTNRTSALKWLELLMKYYYTNQDIDLEDILYDQAIDDYEQLLKVDINRLDLRKEAKKRMMVS